MTTDQWLTLGIYLTGVVFTVVGFFIVRELRRNDGRLDRIESKLWNMEHRDGKKTTRLKIIELALIERKILPPSIVPFKSPSDSEEIA